MSQPEQRLNQSRGRGLLRLLLLLTIAAAFAGFYLSGLHREFDWATIRGRVQSFRGQVEHHLALAIVAFVLVYVAVTALSLPVATAVSLLGGALFGRWLGTGVVSVASTVGATLAFLGSRFLFRDFVERRYGDRLRAIRAGVERDGAYYLFTLRLVPLFPYFLVNLAMGLTRLRVRTFVWVSWLGMLPGTFVIVNLGTEIERIDSLEGLVSWRIALALALVGLVPLLFRLGFRRRGR